MLFRSGTLDLSCVNDFKLNNLIYAYNCISLRVHAMRIVIALLCIERYLLTPLCLLLLQVLLDCLLADLRDCLQFGLREIHLEDDLGQEALMFSFLLQILFVNVFYNYFLF